MKSAESSQKKGKIEGVTAREEEERGERGTNGHHKGIWSL